MITVFTSTYNRAYTLPRLYESLVGQKKQNFEWLLIDDGSVDETRHLVETFQEENKIDIRYIYCKNGGKQRAINYGIELARGELFFIVDSDDYLLPDALEQIGSAWHEVTEKESYAGLCFRKIKSPAMTLLGDPFPHKKFDTDSLELAYTYEGNIDKAEVFQTAVLKNFPFPEIVGENFVPEALVWFRMAAAGFRLRCIDEGIYVCEYLSDGLTRHFSSNLKRNYQGFALFYRELLRYKQPAVWPDKLKACIRLLQCKWQGLIR